jgi:hypothetical protein
MTFLSIVLPVAEEDVLFLNKQEIISKFPTFIIDVGTMAEARRRGINRVTTEFTLCLDADTILPDGYIEAAITLLQKNSNMVVVATDYTKIQGHLAFGTSIWKTEVLKELYDYQERGIGNNLCECLYMWSRVIGNGYSIGTVNYKAFHVKEK